MKTAIITGSSRGIGEAMTMKLGETGYNVVINYRSNSSKSLTYGIVERLKSEFWTDMLRGVNKDEVAALAQNIPMGKIGDVEDIANPMEFLIKDKYMKGKYVSPNGCIYMP